MEKLVKFPKKKKFTELFITIIPLALILLFVTSMPLASAENFLAPIYSKPGLEILFEFDDEIEKEGEKFKENIIYKNLNSLNSTSQLSPLFKINTAIFDNKEVTIPTFSGPITFETTSIEKENESEFIWKGRDKITSAYATIVVNGENIVGNIHINENLYSIKPLGDGFHVLVEVNTGVFIDEPPEFDKIIIKYPFDWWNEYNRVLKLTPCPLFGDNTIDIMVLYTENVDSLLLDIDDEILLALTETNDSHTNSDTKARYSIVHSQEVDYDLDYGTLSNIEILYLDRDNLQGSDDGELDFVHNLRNIHCADIVVLIKDILGYGGIAFIDADESRGFAVVDYISMTGYYSFGHEIGHIHGARHIVENDASDEPFEFGHGLCDPDLPLEWRTIMAYKCPAGTGGPRIQNWSNPDITYAGDAIGTEELHDNARVHDETFYKVCSFRNPDCLGLTAWLDRIKIFETNYQFCFSEFPTTGGLSTLCRNEFDPCGCGIQAPVCEKMLCPDYGNLQELIIFTQLQEFRPYKLIDLGVEANLILPRDGMVILESEHRDDTVIRFSAAGAEKLIKMNPGYWDYR